MSSDEHQEQEEKTTQTTEPQRTSDTENIQPDAEITEKGEEIKADLDRLLDEIDEILEEDSEEFVANYIQRGGE